MVLIALAVAVQWLLPKISTGNATRTPNPTPSPPLLTRPQLLENQQAMPELADFDAQTTPPNPINGGGQLGSPSPYPTLAQGFWANRALTSETSGLKARRAQHSTLP
jgi:hypothetical protein